MLFSNIYFMSSAQGDWGILNKLDKGEPNSDVIFGAVHYFSSWTRLTGGKNVLMV